MKFGDYLRQKREDRGWTQPEAAARAKIKQSYLSKLETGRSYPSDDVFQRLVEVFEIDTTEMSESVSPAELDRLREIREVRTAVLATHASRRRLARSWLVLGLALLMLGGGAVGLSRIDLSRDQDIYYYRSEGVLRTNESPNAFDYVPYSDAILFSDGSAQSRREAGRAMLERIDQDDLVTDQNRGNRFIETVENGRRYYQLYDRQVEHRPSPLRWFLVPGLMLLLGAMGCFFISFRWK